MEPIMLTADDIDRFTTVLDRWFGLDALWLYGSEAEGTARADSDVDLAALFRRPPQGLEIFDARAELEELLCREIDLVDLDQAPPILAIQILKHGRYGILGCGASPSRLTPSSAGLKLAKSMFLRILRGQPLWAASAVRHGPRVLGMRAARVDPEFGHLQLCLKVTKPRS